MIRFPSGENAGCRSIEARRSARGRGCRRPSLRQIPVGAAAVEDQSSGPGEARSAGEREEREDRAGRRRTQRQALENGIRTPPLRSRKANSSASSPSHRGPLLTLLPREGDRRRLAPDGTSIVASMRPVIVLTRGADSTASRFPSGEKAMNRRNASVSARTVSAPPSAGIRTTRVRWPSSRRSNPRSVRRPVRRERTPSLANRRGSPPISGIRHRSDARAALRRKRTELPSGEIRGASSVRGGQGDLFAAGHLFHPDALRAVAVRDETPCCARRRPRGAALS